MAKYLVTSLILLAVLASCASRRDIASTQDEESQEARILDSGASSRVN